MLGPPAMPVYLLDGEKPAIFDAGLAFLGKIYVDGIRQILGHRNLQYCFLTHSHLNMTPFRNPNRSSPLIC
jgi:glyoxylase-like metal-dependent hydrolase (beta-lactamase superfamily II)